MVAVAGHQGAGFLTFAYRQSWPLADMTRFIVNYLRLFAADPSEREPRPPPRRRPRRPVDQRAAETAASLPRTEKGLATRARIVNTAADLILEQGVHRTSLIDVRKAARVSGSQLSHYFTDKQALTREVIAARADFVHDFHTQPQLRRLDTLQSLQTWAHLSWEQSGRSYLENGCAYGSLAGELLEADESLLDDLAGGYDRWLHLFEDGLQTMLHRGTLRPDADPRHLAVALLGAHQGGAMLTHMMKSPEPFRTAADAAVDYVSSFRASKRRPRAESRARP
jgi:AcrR family transcriptional regulator